MIGDDDRRRVGASRALTGLVLAALSVPLLGPPAAADHGVGTPDADITFDGESGVLPTTTTSANTGVTGAAAHTGNFGLRLSGTEAASYVTWSTEAVPQGRTHSSVRTWVRLIDRGPGQSVDLLTVGNNLKTANFDLFVTGDTQRFKWDLHRDDYDLSDFVVDFNRWYLLEAQVEFAGTEHAAEVRIDGVPQGTITSTGTGTAVRRLTVGTAAEKSHTQHYDDIAFAVGDGPLGWFDDTPPEVTLTRPRHGVAYRKGQAVVADFACTDGQGDLESCTGPIANGQRIDTTTVGRHEFVVTGTDHAGNATSVTHAYRVAMARPDARIKRAGTRRWTGNNRYGAIRGQTVKGSRRPGRSVTYYVSAQNDARFAERMRLRSKGSTRAFKVRFYSPSGANITGKVTAPRHRAAFRTPVIRPGRAYRVRVVVTVHPFTPRGASLSRTVTVRSTTHSRSDAVRFITRRS